MSAFNAVADDFNYPMPNRRDLMSNISQNFTDVTRIQPNPAQNKIERQFRSTSLFTGDIQGAQSSQRAYKFTNKECFINKCDDIIDSKKAQIIRESQFLQHGNLPGNKPKINQFSTQRRTNPIVPSYQLPSYIKSEIIQPKFIKDPLEIDDIDGTRSKRDAWWDYTRNIDPYTEIEGSRPRVQKLYKDKTCQLKVKDINQVPWKSGRNTNPQNPEYFHQIEQNKAPTKYGYIEGSECKPQIRDLKKEKDFNLKTQDIIGAQADFCLNNSLLIKTRSQFVKTNRTDDIKGAQVGSLQKHIKTTRQTNPLLPHYQALGRSEDNEYYQNEYTTSEKEMKLHTKLQYKPHHSVLKENSVQLPAVHNSSKNNNNRPPSDCQGERKRSYRSYTSNVSGGSKAQKLDSFINK